MWEDNKPFLLDDAKRLLNERFETIDYAKGWDFTGCEDDFENALNIAKNADVVIIPLF